MKAHIVENGVVTNTIEVDSLDVFTNLVDGSVGGIGWTVVDGVFTAPPAPEVTANPVPQIVSMRQARLALLEVGLLDDITAAITALGQAAAIEWEYATEVRRDSPLIAVVQANAGLSDRQVDDLFVAASAM